MIQREDGSAEESHSHSSRSHAHLGRYSSPSLLVRNTRIAVTCRLHFSPIAQALLQASMVEPDGGEKTEWSPGKGSRGMERG